MAIEILNPPTEKGTPGEISRKKKSWLDWFQQRINADENGTIKYRNYWTKNARKSGASIAEIERAVVEDEAWAVMHLVRFISKYMEPEKAEAARTAKTFEELRAVVV